MLQRFEFTKLCMGENVEGQFSRNSDIFSINRISSFLSYTLS